MATNRGDDGGESYPQVIHKQSYPQVIHKQGVSYPQDIHRLSTGYPQVIHRLSTGYPQARCELSTGYPQVIHKLSTWLSTGYPQQRPPFKRHLRALKEPCRRGGSHRDHGTEHNQERFLTVYTESKG